MTDLPNAVGPYSDIRTRAVHVIREGARSEGAVQMTKSEELYNQSLDDSEPEKISMEFTPAEWSDIAEYIRLWMWHIEEAPIPALAGFRELRTQQIEKANQFIHEIKEHLRLKA